jgi:aminomethyltransferase
MFVFDLSPLYRRIRVHGSSRIDFLHRMSTGNLLGMQPGEGRMTVFTTPIGRMVDAAVVLAFEDSLLVLSGAGPGKLERWLRKYIFFNDDVQLADESEAGASPAATPSALPMWGLYGEGDVAEVYAPVAGMAPLAGRTPYAFVYAGNAVLVQVPPLAGQGYYLLGETVSSTQSLSPLSLYQDLRIRAGYPAAPGEINDEHIPLEAGLNSAISFTKGCYIGQEIIARMESRGQLARRLVKLESEAVLHESDALQVDGNVNGSVTVATSDGHAGLGYVRSSFANTGQVLTVGEQSVRVTGLAGF